MAEMQHVRRGAGKPLLLVHGLGGNWTSWNPVIDALAVKREVIAVSLPGFGDTPPLKGVVSSISSLADALTSFLRSKQLLGIDAVGSSMGARLVLELARRGGVLGGVVALNPGGFWRGWERHIFYASIAASVKLVRLLQPAMDFITGSLPVRSAFFIQFSARPWALDPKVALEEMRAYGKAVSTDELLYQLAYGEAQKSAPKGSIKTPLVIAWGRADRVTLPRQAPRALAAFPDARLHWFEGCGHFPHWDCPQDAVRLILDTLGTSS